eukprot:35070-Amphidinium_carterae.1
MGFSAEHLAGCIHQTGCRSSHLLPTLHKLAATRGAADGGVKALPGPPEAAQQEYTSIQMNRVSELQ